jgi:3-hydroxyisobutyrate dehydrogenase-like beta-hydroxyacid dehydrogenase
MAMKLGFIGTGNMGQPMSHRLIDRGYLLTVRDIRKEAVAPLISRGAQEAQSPVEVASNVEMAMASLPTPDVVQEVALGPDGLIHGSALRIFVDLSTTGPRVTEFVASKLGEKGIAMISAAVSGGVAGAKKGTLSAMASGPRQVFEQIRPVLEVIAKNIYYIGESPGVGQMLKLINNLLSATTLAVSSEAFVLGVKAGLDPEIMVKVINTSTGRSGATEDKFPGAILPRTFDAGFTTDLMYKDVKLCLEQAEQLGVPMWVGNAVRQLWAYALSQGGGPRDFTTIIQYIETWAGVEVGKSPG